MSFWENFKAWVKQPFAADMDVLHWFLFLGLLLLLAAAWGMILRHITEGSTK